MENNKPFFEGKGSVKREVNENKTRKNYELYNFIILIKKLNDEKS